MNVLRDAALIRNYKSKGVVPFGFGYELEYREGKLVKLYRQTASKWFAGELETTDGRIHVSGIASEFMMDDHGNMKRNVTMGIEGLWIQENPKYAPTLVAHNRSVVRILPWTRDTVVSYLASDLFDGIGVKTAENIWNIFGVMAPMYVADKPDYVGRWAKLTDKQIESLRNGAKMDSPEQMRRKRFPHMSDKLFKAFMTKYKSVEGMPSSSTWSGAQFVKMFEDIGYLNVGLPGISFHDVDIVMRQDLHKPVGSSDRMRTLQNLSFRKLMRDNHVLGMYLNRPMFNRAEHGLYSLYEVMAAMADNDLPAGYDMTSLWTDLQRSSRFTIEVRNGCDGTDWYYIMERDVMVSVKNIAVMIRDAYVQNLGSRACRINIVRSYVDQRKAYMICHNKPWLNKEQEDALISGLCQHMTVLGGGPGRGKTFLVKEWIKGWQTLYGDNIVLLGPTGRSVNRLQVSTGYDNCGTIERFLLKNAEHRPDEAVDAIMSGVQMPQPVHPVQSVSKSRSAVSSVKNGGGVMKSPVNGEMIVGESTLVIVDEVSMVNTLDVARLLHVTKNCSIIFIGDNGQLAPIDPGEFLNEFLRSKTMAPSMLVQNMRAQYSELIDNADKIRDGQLLTIRDCTPNFMMEWYTDDELKDADKLYNNAVSWYLTKLQASNGCYDNMMLLSPYRSVVTALNSKLQNVLVPASSVSVSGWDKQLNRPYDTGKGYCIPYARLYGMSSKQRDGENQDMFESVRIFDRVMNIKNNVETHWVRYEDNNPDLLVVEDGAGVWNGDVGVVVRFYPEYGTKEAEVMVQMDDGRFVMVPFDELRDYCLAYATTVHKSQGSEANHVLIVLPYKPFTMSGFLTRNLLYTAITRAQESVVLMGSLKSFKQAVQTPLDVTPPELSFYLANAFHDVGLTDDQEYQQVIRSMGLRIV